MDNSKTEKDELIEALTRFLNVLKKLSKCWESLSPELEEAEKNFVNALSEYFKRLEKKKEVEKSG